MDRTRLQPRQVQLVQPLAHRAQVHVHRKAAPDLSLQVSQSPSHDVMALRSGALNDQCFQFRLLCIRQKGLAAGATARLQSICPAVVIAMHPIAQRLSVHPRLLRRLGSRVPIQHKGDRQQAPNLRSVATLARDRPQLPRRVIHLLNRQSLSHPMLPPANWRRRRSDQKFQNLGIP